MPAKRLASLPAANQNQPPRDLTALAIIGGFGIAAPVAAVTMIVCIFQNGFL